MKRLFYVFIGIIFIHGVVYAYGDETLLTDSFDPLYMVEQEHLLSTTGIEYNDDIVRIGQDFAYGLNERLIVDTNVHYQFDFVRARKERGFSSIEFGGIYRAGIADDNSTKVSTDILFGAKFAGNRHVREPDYAKSTYFAGLRVGRQWSGLTLSGIVKSTWIFDDTRGMAYIDFVPEAYFRVTENWRFGLGGDVRVATNPLFDREWFRLKLVRQFGNTQYSLISAYEYEKEALSVGVGVNVLF